LGSIKISEVFLSLQGEGLYAGEPTIFIRLQGCNLFGSKTGCCTYCDTAYAQALGGQEVTVEEIVKKVRDLSPMGWVCITGGEPLNQLEGLEALVEALNSYKYRVEIETNGTIPKPSWYGIVDSWSADIKCPSSGVTSLVDEWFGARKEDQLKFVCGTKEDLAYTQKLIETKARRPKVLVSPVLDGSIDIEAQEDWLREVWQFCIEERVRFSLQIHKVVFGNRKGV